MYRHVYKIKVRCPAPSYHPLFLLSNEINHTYLPSALSLLHIQGQLQVQNLYRPAVCPLPLSVVPVHIVTEIQNIEVMTWYRKV
jgi:hypothetical protein